MKARGVFFVGKFVVLGFAFLVLFTWVVMLLWNWLVPELFGGPVLNYWQTLGILILAKILFAGMGRSHPRNDHRWWRDRSWRHEKYKSYWRKKFEEKMNGSVETPESSENQDKTGEG